MKKENIRVAIANIDVTDMKLEDLELLIKKQKDAGAEFVDFDTDINYDRCGDSVDSVDASLEFYTYRDETDEEFNQRKTRADKEVLRKKKIFEQQTQNMRNSVIRHERELRKLKSDIVNRENTKA